MEYKHLPRKSRREKGQTILLVAISLISLLAMAALAIDIVTLYSAQAKFKRQSTWRLSPERRRSQIPALLRFW